MTVDLAPIFEDPSGRGRKRTSSSPEPRRSARIRSKLMDPEENSSRQVIDDGTESDIMDRETVSLGNELVKWEPRLSPVKTEPAPQKTKESVYNDRNFLVPGETEETPEEQRVRLALEVRQLQDRLQRFETHHILRQTMSGSWASFNPQRWALSMRTFIFEQDNWVQNNALESPDALGALSAQQKRQLVASLDGYCVQEDLESIVSRCHERARRIVVSSLVSASLYKHLVSKILSQPFWYLTAHPETAARKEEEEEDAAKMTFFRSELHALYDQYLRVNPMLAHMWRWLTVRLANSEEPHDTLDPTFAHAVQAYKLELATIMVDEILADPVFQCLLRPVHTADEVEYRREDLIRVYRSWASGQSCYWAHPEYPKFEDLRDISPRYHVEAGTVKPELSHLLQESDYQALDGHRILILSVPVIYTRGGTKTRNPTRLLFPGRASIEQEPL